MSDREGVSPEPIRVWAVVFPDGDHYSCDDREGAERVLSSSTPGSRIVECVEVSLGAADALREAAQHALIVLDVQHTPEAIKAANALRDAMSAPVASAGTIGDPVETIREMRAERQHEADATPNPDSVRDIHDHAIKNTVRPPASTEPVAHAPDLPPGYTIREATNRDATLLRRPRDPDYEEAWINRDDMRASAWAEYGRAAWQSARPDREVMDLLRDTHASLDEVHSALFDRCGGVPPATMDERHVIDRGMAMLARLARVLGEGR